MWIYSPSFCKICLRRNAIATAIVQCNPCNPFDAIDKRQLPLYNGHHEGATGMQMTIDRFGRMVLPKALRDGLGLGPGDTLQAIAERGDIVLRPIGREDALRRKGKTLVFSGKGAGDIERTVRDLRGARIDRLAGWDRKS